MLWADWGIPANLSWPTGTILSVTTDVTATMGRSNAPRVEAVAARVLDDCLIRDGSLLTPAVAIWRPELLAELHTHYVDAPDPSEGSFADKLAVQLAGVSDHARQLFAELYVLNLLPVSQSDFRQQTKIDNVNDILAPIKPPIPIPPDVVEAFAGGVFRGGRAWKNRRWAQLSFLVEFAEHFKQQDPATRAAAGADPALLRKIVMDSPGHPEPAQRQALLYLFHPEYFLPIVSGKHRRWLREGLGPAYLPGGKFTEDLDADLHTITTALQKEAGRPVDVYDATWKPKWFHGHDKRTDSPDDDTDEDDTYTVADIVEDGSFHPADRLRQILTHWRDKQNLVLQGAPGTGKTWLAKKLAEALIREQAPDANTSEAIRSVQFHPNTSYEDFVRGWRPDGRGHLELTDGVLLQHAERARQHPGIPHVLIIEEINRGNPAQAFGEMLTLIEKSKRNQDDALTLSYPRPDEQYWLPPNLYLLGTMNVADRSLAMVDFALRRRFRFETLEPALTDAWADDLRSKLPVADADLVEQIRSKIEALNARIADDEMLGPHFKVGHSFVTPNDRQDDGRAWFTGVIDTEIAPLLREYWFDDRGKAEDAVNALRL